MRTSMFVAACVLMGSGSALAQPPVVVSRDAAPSAVVSFADLNIWSQAGQERLTHRIRAAASDICISDGKTEVKVAMAERRCFNTALGSGMRQMQTAVAARPGSLAVSTLIVSAR
jgi:UrcA family protein